MFAAVGDTSYNIVLYLHILTAIVGLAPAFVDPIVAMRWADDKNLLQTFAGTLADANQKIFGTALIVSGILGFALAGMSDKVYKMSQTWLLIAAIAWVAMVGILHGVLIPAGKRLSEGDDSVRSKLTAAGPVFTLLALVLLYLMIFKPGA